MNRFIAVFCLAVIPLMAPAASAQAQRCQQLSHLNNHYTICEIDSAKSHIGLFWRGTNGAALKSFRNLASHLSETGKSVSIAMNGGMYHQDFSPVGLFVKNGKQLKSASTKGGWGNFHLLPNGIFFIDQAGMPGVMETKAFLKRNTKVRLATQSGPMLVIDGKLHPRFLKDATSRKLRNGIGVKRDGKTVVFAISDTRVTFYEFGKLFQQYLNIDNALFLDGSVSSLYAEELNRSDDFRPMGPILGVVD